MRSHTCALSTNTKCQPLHTHTHTHTYVYTHIPNVKLQSLTFLTSLVKCTSGRSRRLCLMQACEHKAEWSENSLNAQRYDSNWRHNASRGLSETHRHTHGHVHATPLSDSLSFFLLQTQTQNEEDACHGQNISSNRGSWGQFEVISLAFTEKCIYSSVFNSAVPTQVH